jgi:glycine betaine/proline transport system ATP-binding protein
LSQAGPASPKIKCDGVWKIYGPAPRQFFDQHGGEPSQTDFVASGHVGAVRSVSLEIESGKVFVIMGLSGSGKSTLLRCLSRLIEPTAGAVRIDGQDILSLPEAELTELRRAKIGMVFQNFALLPHDTVLENVAFPLEIRGTPRASREKRALEMIDLVGLRGRENYYPRELSGGQQQRVGIARALTIDPEILFMDEPFSALDPLIRKEMQNELIQLQQRLQKTIVFITHDFDEAIRLADSMAIMRDGEVVQTGTPEELVVAPADNYVREFTRDVVRIRVLRVRSLMKPGPDERLSMRVLDTARLEDVAAELIDRQTDAVVVNSEGTPVGVLEKQRVLDALLNRGSMQP